MKQSDTIYNNTYDAPKVEFADENKNKKCCYKCKHYGCLANQGYWWCNLQLNMDDPENCEEYDGSLYDNSVTTYSSSYTISEQKPKGGMTPKQYGQLLMKRGKRKRTR